MRLFKLHYIYFFPAVFFPFLNIYQFRNNADFSSSFFSNLIISVSAVLMPLFFALSMLITKLLYRDSDRQNEYRHLVLGSLCLIFIMISNFYQLHKFSDFTSDTYRLTTMLSFLAACFISSLCFSFKYKKYAKQHEIDFSTKTLRFAASGCLPLFIAITMLFVV